jgi:putative FmdB family regulatory protein
MPIYEYECKSCGRFEVMQKITEEPLQTCETCGSEVRRLVSLSSFALVGGGWYKDLYSSSKPDSSSDVKAPKPTSTETKTEAKVETKAEAKPAAAPAA